MRIYNRSAWNNNSWQYNANADTITELGGFGNNTLSYVADRLVGANPCTRLTVIDDTTNVSNFRQHTSKMIVHEIRTNITATSGKGGSVTYTVNDFDVYASEPPIRSRTVNAIRDLRNSRV